MFNENIFHFFNVIQLTQMFIPEITKGQNSVKNVDGITLIMLYIEPRFTKYLPVGFRVIDRI